MLTKERDQRREERTFSLKVENEPGLLARVESIFRRQRTPIRSFFFEREEGRAAALTIVAFASGEAAGLLRKQLMRLHDVLEADEVAEPLACAESPFTFEEKTA